VSRTVDWSGGRVRQLHSIRGAASLSQRLSAARRAGSSRTRSPEDAAMLTRMARAEIRRRREQGRLVRVGEREYVLRLPAG
jgi:hypothetical protein